MKPSILIVEDQFIEANNLRLILDRAGYEVLPVAASVPAALRVLETHQPGLALVDIRLDGVLTGIDLARILNGRNIPFVFVSANTNRPILNAAKTTRPAGFLVKPFRLKDVLTTMEIALYLHGGRERSEEGLEDLDPVAGAGEEARGVLGAGGRAGVADIGKKLIWKSQVMQTVMENVRLVAPSQAAVLILGESGTGKELIARSIHEASNRRSAPFVVVNCGAIPANLLESELFGHEKGAFTGATDRRIGKFEQAEGGTIFLDEIGELPADMQVSFLRVLQEREIEAVGGKTKRVDIRVVAATNRNLAEQVGLGRFRMDLYYRVNVFPIPLPPLRQRREDILPLAEYFVRQFGLAEGKVITGFSAEMAHSLLSYDWPGNVRELENAMRRAALLAKGPVVEAPLAAEGMRTFGFGEVASGRLASGSVGFGGAESVGDSQKLKSIADNERDHILAALRFCNWKVYGPGGAAELLKIHVSTLNSRIKKLGIAKERGPERRPGRE